MVKGLLCGLCQTLLFSFQTYHVKWSVDLQHQRQVMGKVKYSIYLKNYCITFEYLPMSVCDFTVLNWALMVSYKTDIWYSKMIDWCTDHLTWYVWKENKRVWHKPHKRPFTIKLSLKQYNLRY
jgi:hypothetical protein